MNKEDSKEGPYKIEWSGENRTARVLGPDLNGQWQKEPTAIHRCADMNAAYKAGVDSVKAIPEGEVVKMEERIKKLELDLGLMTIDRDYYKKMEAACFLALQDRDAEIDDLKNQCMQMAHTLTTLDNPDPEPL